MATNVATIEDVQFEHPNVIIHEQEDKDKQLKTVVFVCTLVSAVIYFLMTILGSVFFNNCPFNGNLGPYTVVLGMSMMTCSIIAAVGIKCDNYNVFALIAGSLIFVFSLIWSGFGMNLVLQSPCRGLPLHTVAIVFSLPLWMVLVIVIWYLVSKLLCK